VFLGSYRFYGDPAKLRDAYDRLMEGYPPEAVQLHVCVIHADGITVYDACPSLEVFEDFSIGEQFAAAVASAGLPPASVTPLGEVHAAHLREEATGP
jgi:hypothetical protein